MNKKIIRNVVVGIALAVFVGLSILVGYSQITVTKAPKNETVSTSEQNKSSQSMLNVVFDHMKAIGDEVHSTGTKENEKVRDYITEVLDELNIDYTVEPFEFDVDAYAKNEVDQYNKSLAEYPELEDQNKKFLADHNYKDATDYTKDMIGLREESKVTLNNILAMIDSPNTDQAVLFVTHYDSRPDVANASAASLGVATFLNAIKNQLSRNSLNTDLYFLFTDGKEIDELGAKEFVESHKELMNSVQVVLNFDSQGTEGPLFLYETSNNDNSLLKQYKEAVSENTSYSFLTGLCKLFPIESDFKIFNEAGLQSMNFTMMGSANPYSRKNNTVETIDKDSVYTYAKTVDQFVSYYACQTKSLEKDSDGTVFFNLGRGHVITLPGNVVSLMTYFTSIIAICLLVGFKVKKEIRFRAVARTTIFSILSILLTGLITAAFIGPQLSTLSTIDTKGKIDQLLILFIGSIAFASLCTTVFIRIAMRKNNHLLSSLMGLLPIPLTIGLVLGQKLISLSYLFTVTIWAIFTLIAVCACLKDKPQIQKWWYLGVSIVFGVILLVVFTPIVYLVNNILPLHFMIINIALCCIPISVFAGMAMIVYKVLLEGSN